MSRKTARVSMRAAEIEIEHDAQTCPKCGNYCISEGMSYVHGDGVASGSCVDLSLVARGETAAAIADALDGEAARFETIGWSVAAGVWRQTATFVREWVLRTPATDSVI